MTIYISSLVDEKQMWSYSSYSEDKIKLIIIKKDKNKKVK